MRKTVTPRRAMTPRHLVTPRRKASTTSFLRELTVPENRSRMHDKMEMLIFQGLGWGDAEQTDRIGKNEDGLVNIDFDPESPNAASPQIRSEKLQEIDLDLLANTNLGNRSGSLSLLKKVAMIAAAGYRTSLFVNFNYGYEKYGGMAYVLVFVLSLFLVAVPIAIMELAVGQYSALPPIKLFSRISQSSTAIGILIVVYRLMITLQEVIDGRPFHTLIETVFDRPEVGWAQFCHLTRDPFCFYLMKKNGTGRSVVHSYWFETAGSTVPTNHIWRLMSHSPVTFVSSAELHELTIQKYHTRHYMSVVILLAVAGIIGHRGMSCFAWFSLGVVVAPLLMHIGEFVFGLIIDAPLVGHVFEFNYKHLLCLNTYIHAISLSLQILSVGNGSWLILGTLSPYKSNIIMPVLVTAAFYVFALFISSLSYASGLPAAIGIHAVLTDSLPIHDRRVDPFGNPTYENWFRLTYYYTHMIMPRVATILAMLLRGVTLLPYIVLTIELVVQTVYRLAPMFYRLPTGIVYSCIINTLFCVCLVAFEHKDHFYIIDLNTKVKVMAQMTILLMEIYMIAQIYRDTRLLINIRTMLSEKTLAAHPYYFRKMAVLTVAWRYFCPAVITVCFMHQLFCSNRDKHGYFSLLTVSIRSTLVCIAVFTHMFIVFIKITSAKFKGLPVWTIFVPNNRWGPANFGERRRVSKFERAARIFR